MIINAIGKACPTPVILAKKELDAGCTDLIISVDNETAVGNLSRLADSQGMESSATAQDGIFQVHIFGGAAKEEAMVEAAKPVKAGYAVFIGKDYLGAGAEELGKNLLKMAIYTLSQGEDIPESILFMNAGVKLPAGDEEQIIANLQEMADKGCEILVCGTCLNFYGLADALKVGTVSNMYDILSRMLAADKVITL